MRQAASILLVAILASVAYGVIHDQVTARLSLEYFTVGHPRLFANDSPTLHGAAWGAIATWWMGAILGALLALCARAGPPAKLETREVLPLVAGALGVAAAFALAAGLAAWLLSARGAIELAPRWRQAVSPEQQRGFLVASWVHIGSYVGGAVGGIGACAQALRRRLRAPGSAD